jgi:methanogenic corrinoid protein MtbC1
MTARERVSLAGWIGRRAPHIAQTAARSAYGPDGARAARHFELAFRQLAIALQLDEIDLYLGDLRWLIEAAPAHRTEPSAIIASAVHSIEVLAARAPKRLRPAFATIAERVRGLAREPARPPRSFLTGTLSRTYFTLCGSTETGAARFVKRALSLGISHRALYLDVMAPAQREAGRRWQLGWMSDEQERMRTALTQRLMIALRSAEPQAAAPRGVLAGATAPGEAHQIGLQMVCDLAAHDGWSTVVVPSGLEAGALVAALAENRPDAIALSATMLAHVTALISLIARVRAEPQLRAVPILVGGAPFTQFPHLAGVIGADATAADAAEAIEALRAFARV